MFICVFAIVLVVGVSSYALWQITKQQNDENELAAACLDFDLTNTSSQNTGITINSAWPMSYSEGLASEDNYYNFVVTNHCSSSVYYDIGLEKFSTGNDLLDSSITVALDNSIGKYGSLINLTAEDSSAITSKRIGETVVPGKDSNTHRLKLWINNDAPISEQWKGFNGKIFVVVCPCHGWDENIIVHYTN